MPKDCPEVPGGTEWLSQHHPRGLHQLQLIFIQLGESGSAGRSVWNWWNWRRVMRSLAGGTGGLKRDSSRRIKEVQASTLTPVLSV